MPMIAGSAALGTGMAGALYTALQGVTGFSAGTAGQQLADAIASTVVAYITANAVVVPTALVAPPAGGPVTGAGTVT